MSAGDSGLVAGSRQVGISKDSAPSSGLPPRNCWDRTLGLGWSCFSLTHGRFRVDYLFSKRQLVGVHLSLPWRSVEQRRFLSFPQCWSIVCQFFNLWLRREVSLCEVLVSAEPDSVHCIVWSHFSRLAVSKCSVIYPWHVCDLSQTFLLLKCCVSECFWLIAESMAPVSCIMYLLWCFLYHVSCFMVSRPIAGKVYSSNALCTVSMYSYELWQGGRMLWWKGDVSLMNPTWRLISTHKKSSSLHEMCAELVQHLEKFAP